MNIDLMFIDSFPSIEKLANSNELYIQINTERFNLKKLIETNKAIHLKNIQNEIFLKILFKEKIIIGKNIFNPKIFKNSFLTNPKPIYHWLDFKQEKNNYINNNINYFLYEFLRLKIKIVPLFMQEMSEQKKMNNTFNKKKNSYINHNINNINYMKKSSKKIIEKSYESGKKATLVLVTKDDFFKNKILKAKNNKISLNIFPGPCVINNDSFNSNSTRNISPFKKTNKNIKMNNSLSSKQNISSETYYTNNNYNKQLNMKKKSSKDVSNNHKQPKKNKLSLFGEELLLNDNEEVLYYNDNNKNGIKMDSNFMVKNETSRKNSINNNNIILYNDYDNSKENSNAINAMNSSFSEEIIQFNILKNDFYLFYTQKFIKNINNDYIIDEFLLFLQKSISLFIFYRDTASLLLYENKYLLNALNHYRKILKLIKKKKSKLSILKDDNDLKEKTLKISKESNSKILESIISQNSFNKEVIQKIFIINRNKEMIKIIKNIINQNIFLNLLRNNNHKNKTENNFYNNNDDERMHLSSTGNKTYKTLNEEDFNKSIKSKIINKKAYIDNKFNKIKQTNSFVINNNTKNIINKNIINIKDFIIKKNEKAIMAKFKTIKFKTNGNTPKKYKKKTLDKK
jgi:hypothetical protein